MTTHLPGRFSGTDSHGRTGPQSDFDKPTVVQLTASLHSTDPIRLALFAVGWPLIRR
jgi:hypothetical protein